MRVPLLLAVLGLGALAVATGWLRNSPPVPQTVISLARDATGTPRPSRLTRRSETSAALLQRTRELRASLREGQETLEDAVLQDFARTFTPGQLRKLLVALREDASWFGLTLRTALITVLGETHPDLAGAFLVELPEGHWGRHDLFEPLFTAWAKASPEGLAEALAGIPAPSDRCRAGLLLVASLPPERLPAFAETLLTAFPEKAHREVVLQGVVSAWLAQSGNPTLAAVNQWLELMPAELLASPAVMGSLAHHLTGGQPTTLNAFVAALPAGPGKSAALTTLTSRGGLADWDATLAYAGQQADFPEARTLANTLAHRWAGEAPQAAAQWVASLREPGLAGAAAQGAATVWADTDPIGAATWVAGIENLDAQAAAAKAVADTWSLTRPAEAARWVLAFGDAPLQTDCLTAVLTRWGSLNSGDALAFAQALPEALRATAEAAARTGMMQLPPKPKPRWELAAPDAQTYAPPPPSSQPTTQTTTASTAQKT